MPRQGVRDDVERDEQAVVAPYHARRPPVAHRVVDDRRHLVAEPGAAEALGVAADGGGVEPMRRARRRIAVGERRGRRLVDQHAGLARDDRLERAAPAERDHRAAARLRLDRHDAEVLFAGQQHDGGRARYRSRTSSSSTAAEELDVGADSAARRSSRGALGPVADDASAARRRDGRRRWRRRCACREPARTRSEQPLASRDPARPD